MWRALNRPNPCLTAIRGDPVAEEVAALLAGDVVAGHQQDGAPPGAAQGRVDPRELRVEAHRLQAWRDGIEDSPAFAGEPPCNGCAERFIRTLKEQCLWARLYEDVEDLRQAVIEFTRRYNNQWLIERHGHCTPREAHAAAKQTKAA